jgi:poly-gamma-glutamate synthesis protein (capsule biosynthesis protein)
VLTLANNHMMDYGAQGLSETVTNLDRVKILHAGAGATLDEARRQALVTVKGKRVAFLAYSLTYPAEFYAGSGHPGTAQGIAARVHDDIVRTRGGSDYVVVSFHWGAELVGMPKPYQQRAAHAAIDAGADLVLGHHPHVLQGIERYQGKTIIYSLGNFAFGSMSPSADRSMIARITLHGTEQTVEIVPLNVLNREVRFRPVVLTGKRGDEVIARLNQLSQSFNTRLISSGGRYLLEVKLQTAELRR